MDSWGDVIAMNVRRFIPGEEEALWTLLFDTVHKVNSRDYSQSQIEAWAPHDNDLENWKNRLLGTNPLVAEQDGHPIGFAELGSDGTIDCFYCHWQWQGKGVGRTLMRAIEEESRKREVSSLTAYASITARDFFVHLGFRVEKESIRILRGESFRQFHVSEQLRIGVVK